MTLNPRLPKFSVWNTIFYHNSDISAEPFGNRYLSFKSFLWSFALIGETIVWPKKKGGGNLLVKKSFVRA